MLDEIHRDERWPTGDTRLAACMTALGFTVKKEQPFLNELMTDATTGGRLGTRATIWLEPKCVTADGQELPASRFGIAWQDMPTWAAANKGHPFVYCYIGVMARQYIVQAVVHGALSATITATKARHFTTDNLTLAAALHGMGYKCLGKTAEKEFVFDAVAKALVADFDAPATDTPIQWMKLAVINYHLLNERMKGQDNVPVVTRQRIVNGQLRVLQLPINMSDDMRRQFEAYFYDDSQT